VGVRIYLTAGLVALAVFGGLAYWVATSDSQRVDEDPGYDLTREGENDIDASRGGGSQGGSTTGGHTGASDSSPREPDGGSSTGTGTGSHDTTVKVEVRSPLDEEFPDDAPDIPKGTSDLLVIAMDYDDSPLRGVEVTLRSTTGLESRRGSRSITTDRQGRANYEQIPSGAYAIRVRFEDEEDLRSARDVTLGPGQSEVVEVRVGSFELTIAGRVLDTSGKPLQGVEMQARPYAVGGGSLWLVEADRGESSAVTDADGRFELLGLNEGEYEVFSVETERYPSVRRVVRAGLQSADFVLEEGRNIRVVGIVVDEADGEPLRGVRVLPLGFGSRQAHTAANGRFETTIPLRSQNSIYSVEFRADGFHSDRRTMKLNELRELEVWEIDVALRENQSAVVLLGVLVGTDGSPLSGETIHVHSVSARVRQQGFSDKKGRYEVTGLVPAEDYRAWVYPSGPYRDLMRNGIVIPEGGLKLDFEFEAFESGTITGRIVDVEGNPVPHFSLWVNSTSALNKPRRVATDAKGEFFVEDVPEGDLIFQTRSLPRFTVRGMKLGAGEEAETELLLDWGRHALASVVVDPVGEPVALAKVDLHWTQKWGPGRTTSYRSAVADEAGRFGFTELGVGEHKLRVVAQGFRSRRVDVKIGSDEVPRTIELEPVD